jgi:hypothetical protein
MNIVTDTPPDEAVAAAIAAAGARLTLDQRSLPALAPPACRLGT